MNRLIKRLTRSPIVFLMPLWFVLAMAATAFGFGAMFGSMM